ncbi:hypothetical protein ACMBCN_02545, partial [Candidatus Liberibacter asiaticus]|nr:hypothetical protein [Candidatus Liberibacter asiaticus]
NILKPLQFFERSSSEFAYHLLQVIRTFASTIICLSSFWCRCRGIGVLNNFLFNFYLKNKK